MRNDTNAAAIARHITPQFAIPEEPGHFEELAAAVEELHPFWDGHDNLRHILDYARARRVGPWALLGVVLARAAAAVHPDVKLPAAVGDLMSLNLFVGLVGGSGGGKGAAEGSAYSAVVFEYSDNGGPVPIDTLPIGSGEGLSRAFRPAGAKPDDPLERERVVFSVPEIDSLTALGGRKGATLMPQMRSMYCGEPLGFQNGSKETTSILPRHSYRACLVVGIQPHRAGPLLADVDGGTPQRFVWMPVGDPDAPDTAPRCPEPLRVTLQSMRGGPLEVTPPALLAVDGHSVNRLRGTEGVDPLDGHKLLCRLKVAAALMILTEGSSITDTHWRWAGMVMDVSTRTRRQVERTLLEKSRSANRARAHSDAERAVIVDNAKHEADIDRTAKGITRYLAKHGRSAHAPLRRSIKFDLRGHFDEVIMRLVEGELVREFPSEAGTAYELA